jgi:hypothetical protein
VLRIETIAHNTQELDCGRSLEKFPEIVFRLKSMLERFLDALSCIDQCFIADDMLDNLPAASRVGKTIVGGINLNKPRMHWVVQALIALSASPGGFTASELAAQVCTLSKHTQMQYGPRRAAYDLKKLRGKQIVRRIGHPLRAASDRLEGYDRATRSPKQSYQTSARCRSTPQTDARSTEPKTA